jgi:hypothetical protein
MKLLKTSTKKTVKYLKNKEIISVQDIDSSSCSGCSSNCRGGWGKPAPDSNLAQTAPSSRMLTALVGVLFGLPLALLFGAVLALQLSGLDDDPMISFVCVFSVLLAAGGVIATQGAKLLSKLQVQPSVDLQ